MVAMTTCASLYATLGLPDAPVIVDARIDDECLARPAVIPGAIRCGPDDASQLTRTLPRTRAIVAYCTHGQSASHRLADMLAVAGFPVSVLERGIAGWIDAGHATVRVRSDLHVPGASRWVTRERPKIDRLACPWLVRRFIDPQALFFYAPAHRVRAEATALGAQPYDIADVEFTHRGPKCSFDAFLEEFALRDPVLDDVADIVRAADTGKLGDSPQAPGLLAISLGLSANIADDILLLEQAMSVYDALYAWRKIARNETHSWPAKTV